MEVSTRRIFDSIVLVFFMLAFFSQAQAAQLFGAFTRGDNLEPSINVADGGAGSVTASVTSGSIIRADASFLPGSTFLPELGAFARSTTALNDDDKTSAVAEAFRVFSSSSSQTINLTVTLDGDIIDNSAGSRSRALANVIVFGGSNFEVTEGSQCSDGSFRSFFLFDGHYFCGQRLDRSNLFLSNNGLNQFISDTLTFSASGTFGIFADLDVTARDGTADFSQTLSLQFQDDSFITPLGTPSGNAPEPSAIMLFAIGVIGLGASVRRQTLRAQRQG